MHRLQLTGKTKEEIELIVNYTLWAFNFDMSHINVNAEIIDGATKELAHRYARLLVANIAMVYFERLVRGDGTDPEFEIVKEHCPGESDDERDLDSIRRLINHMRSRTEERLVSLLGEQ